MTDRHLHTISSKPANMSAFATNDTQAVQSLDDGPFIAYALIQAFKLFTALVTKRWPQLR